MSVKSILLWTGIGVALGVLLLLLLPCGRFRVAINRFVKKVLFYDGLLVPLVALVIAGTAVWTATLGYETYNRVPPAAAAKSVDLSQGLLFENKFLRKQRDFWCAFLLLVVWVLDFFVLKLSETQAALVAEKAALEAQQTDLRAQLDAARESNRLLEIEKSRLHARVALASSDAAAVDDGGARQRHGVMRT